MAIHTKSIVSILLTQVVEEARVVGVAEVDENRAALEVELQIMHQLQQALGVSLFFFLCLYLSQTALSLATNRLTIKPV